MLYTQTVHCPDCGKMDQRHFRPKPSEHADKTTLSLSSHGGQVTACTECSHCDYFLEVRTKTGQVLASHLPLSFRCEKRTKPLKFSSDLKKLSLHI